MQMQAMLATLDMSPPMCPNTLKDESTLVAFSVFLVHLCRPPRWSCYVCPLYIFPSLLFCFFPFFPHDQKFPWESFPQRKLASVCILLPMFITACIHLRPLCFSLSLSPCPLSGSSLCATLYRNKHHHSSLDSQTISTFDSGSGGEHAHAPGFYHKYASAWSQLQSSAAVLHSGSYKPSLARLEPYDHHGHHHFSAAGAGLRRMNPVGPAAGAINEGFRDSNEITLNADIYTRSSSGGSSGSSDDHSGRKRFAASSGGGKQRGGGDHE